MRKKLRHFFQERKLEQAIVSYIYSHINANETQYELLEIFRSMDTDGDGTLTFVELTEGIKQRMDIKKVHEYDL